MKLIPQVHLEEVEEENAKVNLVVNTDPYCWWHVITPQTHPCWLMRGATGSHGGGREVTVCLSSLLGLECCVHMLPTRTWALRWRTYADWSTATWGTCTPLLMTRRWWDTSFSTQRLDRKVSFLKICVSWDFSAGFSHLCLAVIWEQTSDTMLSLFSIIYLWRPVLLFWSFSPFHVDKKYEIEIALHDFRVLDGVCDETNENHFHLLPFVTLLCSVVFPVCSKLIT